MSKTPDCRDAIWRRQGHITSARETRLCKVSTLRTMGILRGLLTDALDEGPVPLSEQVRPETFLTSVVLRTAKVQICSASHGNASERRTFHDRIILFTYRCRHRDPRRSLRREGSHLDHFRRLGLSRVPWKDGLIPASGGGRRDSRGQREDEPA